MPAAAFFDLDRTLLRRSSALALAGSFRERGLISRRQLLQAAGWQLLFVARGASHEAVRRAAEDGLRVLAGYPPEELRELVAEAMEPCCVRSSTPSRCVSSSSHRERGERVYIVSATLQEIVDAIAADLGFDGALGTVCEVRDGRYTGRAAAGAARRGEGRLRADLAEREGLDLAECTAYSDSHTDLPFLEAVGHPVAVNPDRELRRIAAERGWPVLEFSGRAYPHARRRIPPAAVAAVRQRAQRSSSPRGPVDAEEGLGRLRALGFGEDDAQELWEHFDHAEQQGKLGHGHSRIEWLETLEGFDPGARPRAARAVGAGLRALGRTRRDRLPRDAGGRAAHARASARARAARSSASGRSRRGCSGYYARQLATRGLVALVTATSPARLGPPVGGPKVAGTNPLAIGIPSSDGEPLVADVSMGAVTWGDVIAGLRVGGRARPVRRRAVRTRRSRSRVGLQAARRLAHREPGHGAVMLVAQPEADPVPALRKLAAGIRLPGDS